MTKPTTAVAAMILIEEHDRLREQAMPAVVGDLWTSAYQAIGD
jgi:hypothetical protein